MLDINVTIQGDKAVINNLQQFAAAIPRAVDRALNRIAKGVDREAEANLRGAGSKASTKKGLSGSAAGSYPVPVRTGHLRRSLDWLKPGETKKYTRHGEDHDLGSFTAGKHEVIVYNAARYADAIHEGKLTTRQGIQYSPVYGARRFLTDALAKFNQGDRIKETLNEEINNEINKRGLK